MGFLARLLLGTGKLKPEMRAQLEAEGLVLIEEGLSGSVRYTHFKAPGKRFHGKITPERMAIAISQRRFVVYCRSGRVKLCDSEWSNPNLKMVDVSLDGDEKLVILVDYDKGDEPNVSGKIKIHAKTPRAREIVRQLETRISPRGAAASTVDRAV